MRHTDYFNPLEDLLKETKIFCSHTTAQAWFDYTNFETMRQILNEARNPELECEAITDHMKGYATRLMQELEGYERYELCRQVQDQMNLFEAQLVRVSDFYKGLDK